MRKLLVVFSALVLSACASNSMALKSSTAGHFDNVVMSDVEISDVERGLLDVKWTAMINGQKYHCEADDMVRKSSCKEL